MNGSEYLRAQSTRTLESKVYGEEYAKSSIAGVGGE